MLSVLCYRRVDLERYINDLYIALEGEYLQFYFSYSTNKIFLLGSELEKVILELLLIDVGREITSGNIKHDGNMVKL